MGILYMNTADVGDTTLFSSPINASVSAVQARTGSKSFALTGTAFGPQFAHSNATEWFLRVSLYFTASSTLVIVPRRAASGHCTIKLSGASKSIEVFRGVGVSTGSPIAVGNLQTGEGAWMAIEVRYVPHSSTGIIQVKENGTLIVDYSGNSSALTAAPWVVSGSIVGGDIYNAALDTIYLDDIIVRDDMWPGRGGIHVLKPNAVGAETDWTLSDLLQDDFEHLDDAPVTYTEYLSADVTVAAQKQLVNIESLGADVWNIRGVGICVNTKSTVSTDSFIRTLALPADIGAVQAVGSDFGVESAASWARTYYHENPHDDAVWEKADVDDLQVGFETRVPA